MSLFSSDIYDVTKNYVSDTYNETVDFWTSGDATERAISAIKFTVENPKLMLDTAGENFGETVSNFEQASKNDFLKLLFLGACGLGAYMYAHKKGYL